MQKGGSQPPSDFLLLLLIARTGLEPVLSALRGRRVNQLHQRAKELASLYTSNLSFIKRAPLAAVRIH